ncbi:hypothetical protein BDV96DRAFT_654128 [Lophiotrema nucula]|uniref:Uncharacterized protein n=1 Tax=Lophiotrema nucula TaxID=690887 RepID=A0A6A5YIW9_9PLEO|nr:hypothetical protein BDV96DRAFT_654128 [Lophiotrema nucula]
MSRRQRRRGRATRAWAPRSSRQEREEVPDCVAAWRNIAPTGELITYHTILKNAPIYPGRQYYGMKGRPGDLKSYIPLKYYDLRRGVRLEPLYVPCAEAVEVQPTADGWSHDPCPSSSSVRPGLASTRWFEPYSSQLVRRALHEPFLEACFSAWEFKKAPHEQSPKTLKVCEEHLFKHTWVFPWQDHNTRASYIWWSILLWLQEYLYDRSISMMYDESENSFKKGVWDARIAKYRPNLPDWMTSKGVMIDLEPRYDHTGKRFPDPDLQAKKFKAQEREAREKGAKLQGIQEQRPREQRAREGVASKQHHDAQDQDELDDAEVSLPSGLLDDF